MPPMNRLVAPALAPLLVLLFLSAANAQKKAIDPAALAAAKELMAASGGAKQFDRVIDTMSQGMANMIKQRNPAKAQDIDEVFAQMAKRMSARKGELLEQIAPLYAENLTIAEMQEIVRFFKSPIGAKMLAAQVDIGPKSMQIGMAWGQRIGQEMEAEARGELKKRGIEL